MATAYKFAVAGQSRNGVNQPWIDTGYRVKMKTGTNPRTTTPVQTHRQYARGAICEPDAHCLRTYNNRGKGWQRFTFEYVSGYGILGR